jgi:O-6-methylguanine DNA methyltransferase
VIPLTTVTIQTGKTTLATWSIPTIEGAMTLIVDRSDDDGGLTIVACAWDTLAATDDSFARHRASALAIDGERDPRLRALSRRIQDAVAGKAVDFAEFRLAPTTPFFAACRAACQAIPPGGTISYSELARRAGSPAAARAAGQAMRRNPMPIIVPCHRVVASDGQLGGYGGAWSSLQRGGEGVEQLSSGAWLPDWGHRNCNLKARLLAREASASAPAA